MSNEYMSEEEAEKLHKEEVVELGKEELEEMAYLGQPINEVQDTQEQSQDNKE